VAVNGTVPDIARIVREHPARVEASEQGDLHRVGVRLQVLREGANAEIELGDNAKFSPPTPHWRVGWHKPTKGSRKSFTNKPLCGPSQRY
jgi:hypothetical protein